MKSKISFLWVWDKFMLRAEAVSKQAGKTDGKNWMKLQKSNIFMLESYKFIYTYVICTVLTYSTVCAAW